MEPDRPQNISVLIWSKRKRGRELVDFKKKQTEMSAMPRRKTHPTVGVSPTEMFFRAASAAPSFQSLGVFAISDPLDDNQLVINVVGKSAADQKAKSLANAHNLTMVIERIALAQYRVRPARPKDTTAGFGVVLVKPKGVGVGEMAKPLLTQLQRTARAQQDKDKVLGRLIEYIGDRKEAERWFKEYHIPGFGGLTSLQLVRKGQTKALLHYINGMFAGSFA
ncbi:hypothetical protein [Rhizobium sp. S163]|uniref:hypothetical protein n=1 Tax=Rhizobium sp. S163 TaxID=3055039 RepID=UPI0025A9D802|nr:hypothetical protein [Rhizobium sp. S163]MDM9645703.1 hypothetical protein [Rhizobium sp. S163]